MYRGSYTLYRLVIYSWNGDGTDGGDGGRAGYCRVAHLRTASLQPPIQPGGALSAAVTWTAAPQVFNAAAGTPAAATDLQEGNIDDICNDGDEEHHRRYQQQQQHHHH